MNSLRAVTLSLLTASIALLTSLAGKNLSPTRAAAARQSPGMLSGKAALAAPSGNQSTPGLPRQLQQISIAAPNLGPGVARPTPDEMLACFNGLGSCDSTSRLAVLTNPDTQVGAGTASVACNAIPVLANRCPIWATLGEGGGDTAMAASPHGDRIFVTGFGAGTGAMANDLAFVTTAYDASTGTQLWQTLFQAPGAGSRNVWAIAASPDGSQVFVAGHQVRPDPNVLDFDYVVVAYSAATGEQLWVSTYSNPVSGNFSFDSARFVAPSPDGHTVYVAGFSSGDGTSFDFATIALAADFSRQGVSPGTILWVARYDGGVTTDYLLGGLAVSPDGNRIFVHGDSNRGSASTYDDVIVAYDATTGAQLWSSVYDGGGADLAFGMALGAGVVVGTGHSQNTTGTGWDIDTVAYDVGTGTRKWVSRYTGLIPGGFNDSFGWAAATDPQGKQVFVTGGTSPLGGVVGVDFDIVTIAYDIATGTQTWSSLFTLPNRNAAYGSGVTLNPDGTKAYVVAQGDTTPDGQNCVGSDYITVAYDATTGNRLWAGPLPREPNIPSYCLQFDHGTVSMGPRGDLVYMAGTAVQKSINSPLGATGGYVAAAYAAGVQLSDVVSRKVHGSAGTFDVDLPLAGSPGIECRSEAPLGTHHVVFKFSTAVTVSDAAVTPNGSDKTAEKDGPPVRSADGKEITINLKNVTNGQTVTIKLLGVNDGSNTDDISVQLSVLLGDTTADGVVNSADIGQTKSQSGIALTNANFREDVTADGAINSGDIALVKSASGTALP